MKDLLTRIVFYALGVPLLSIIFIIGTCAAFGIIALVIHMINADSLIHVGVVLTIAAGAIGFFILYIFPYILIISYSMLFLPSIFIGVLSKPIKSVKLSRHILLNFCTGFSQLLPTLPGPTQNKIGTGGA